MERENRVYALYKSLLKKYGKQNWWPAETPYEVVVGAILTQNTNWKNVEKAIKNLKENQLLNYDSIITIDKEYLESLIKPSGFYKQKAQRLKDFSKVWKKVVENNLHKKYSLTELRNLFLSVKGIGKETADSILLYALNKPIFVIDAYTKHFCNYYSLYSGKEYDDYRLFFEQNLPKDIEVYKEYHALIVKWGKEKRKERFKTTNKK